MEEKTMQQKIDEFHSKQLLVRLPGRYIVLELGEDGKAYVKKVHSGNWVIPKWVSGFQGVDRTFNTLEDLCYYYGLRVFDLKSNMYKFDSLADYIKIETMAHFKGEYKCWALKDICEEFDYDYDKILARWNKSPDLSRDHLLIEMLHECGVDCYRNILGEFVIEIL